MELQFRTSYFYQVRYFNPNILPYSTALYDPSWFHDGRSNAHTFIDSHGVVNGLRCEPIIEKAMDIARTDNSCPCPELRQRIEAEDCPFLLAYRAALEAIPFDVLYNRFAEIASRYYNECDKVDKEKPITIMLLVHETTLNQCSERKELQKYFMRHGVPCSEWEGTVSAKTKKNAAAQYLQGFLLKK